MTSDKNCRLRIIAILGIIILSTGYVSSKSTQHYPDFDTTYLKSDSSLAIINIEDGLSIQLKNLRTNTYLYRLNQMSGHTRLVKKSESLYFFVVESMFPVPGQEDWKSYEIVRYVLWVNGDQHSFYQQRAFANYPKLDSQEIDVILRDAQNARTNSFCKQVQQVDSENYCDEYTRNAGFLALAILSGSDPALNLFNEYRQYGTGGEGCEVFSGKQLLLAHLDFELWITVRNGRRKHYVLKKKLDTAP